MSQIHVDALHSESGSNSNIELDNSRNTTCKGNLTVDGNIAVTGTGLTDTKSFRNVIINGACQIDQRSEGATKAIAADAGSYCADRILIGTWGCGELAYTTQRVNDDAPTGFKYSQKVTVATAESSGGTPAADDRSSVQFRLEGNTVDHFDLGEATARNMVVSFWVKSSLTGNFGLVVTGDSVANQQYGALYAISSANTWEKKTVKIPGPTSGTWKSDTSNAISVKFGLYVGSNKLTSDQGIAGSGSWQTGYEAQGVTGQVQLGGTASATWQVTGVQLEVGDSATDFEHIPFGPMKQRCLRYFWKNDFTHYSHLYHSGGTMMQIRHPVEMRARPTVTITGDSMSTWTSGDNPSDTTKCYRGYLTATTSKSWTASSFDAEL